MSVLAHDEIIKAIDHQEIAIEPFEKDAIGAGSVDLRLGNKFRTFRPDEQVFDVTENLNYQDLTDIVTTDSIEIKPGETILGITQEKITLAPNICGRLEGRSRFARIGLLVHISASFMQPGISNHQVLEICNMGKLTLRLHAGTRFCQFIFERMEGEASYKGKFTDQIEP